MRILLHLAPKFLADMLGEPDTRMYDLAQMPLDVIHMALDLPSDAQVLAITFDQRLRVYDMLVHSETGDLGSLGKFTPSP